MAAFWDSEELVGKITKNSREEIQIKKVQKSGRDYIDIRTFWYDSNSDDYKPSQKGVTVPYDAFEEFRDILSEIDI